MSRGLIRSKHIIVDDVLDKLYKAWIGHKVDELEIRDRYLLERMEYADAKLREGGEQSRYTNLVNDMLERFKTHEIGTGLMLSTRTIESDIARAKRFFLSVRPREDKEYARGKSIEWLERLIWKAEEAGEFKAAAAFIKELDEIQGFKKDDIDLPDYDAVQPAPVMIITDLAELDIPIIDDLEGELRLLNMPKAVYRNTQNIDEAEAEPDAE